MKIIQGGKGTEVERDDAWREATQELLRTFMWSTPILDDAVQNIITGDDLARMAGAAKVRLVITSMRRSVMTVGEMFPDAPGEAME